MTSRRILVSSIASVVTTFGLNLAAHAQATWDGGGADPLWSNALNWVGDVVPISPTPLTFDGNTNLNPNNDLFGFTATGITFGATAGAYNLVGNELVLNGTLLNNSSAEQTLNFTSLLLSGATTIDTSAGAVNLAALVNADGASPLSKNGTGLLKFTNPGFVEIGENAGAAFSQNGGSVLFDGGVNATYSVTGEAWFGTDTNQNVQTTLNSGNLSISTWFAVARGNGTGAVSSDFVANGASTIFTANFSGGFNAGNAATAPRGSVTLNGTSSLQVTNNGNLFHLAESAGSNIVLRLNDSSVLSHTGGGASRSRIGVLGKGLLNIASANATANFNQVHIAAGANGSGAIWNRGMLNVSSVASVDHFAVGNAANAYGYYLNDTETPVALREIGVGGSAGGHGVFEVRTGTVSVGDWITINRGGNATAAMVLVNGTLVPPDISGRFEPNWSTTADQYSIVDVGTGGRINGGANAQISVSRTARAGNFGILTIHGGGLVQTPRITGNATGTTSVNFDNGVVVATASDPNLIGNVFDGVFVHGGGLTIDTAGFNSGVPAPLAAPVGDGLASIPITAGGSGYIGRPIVQITGGGGIGASAVANFDEATGAVTGITITSPGSGYTSAPTITLIGGGGTGATIGTATLAPAAGGGLTKLGTGMLTLGGANSYTGNTVVNGGTLAVTNTAGSGTGSGTVTVNSGAALGGSGVISGAVTINTGGAVAPGVGIGALTVGSITLSAGTVLNYEITNETVLDQLIVTIPGGLTINTAGVNLYIPGSTNAFSANGVYNLIGYSGAIGGTGVAGLSMANAVPGKTYAFGENAGFVTLTVTTAGATANFWNVDADGNWSVGTNWSQGVAPNAPGAIANFGGGGATITAARTVTVNSPQTVGSIGFNSDQPYNIAGASALTLNNGTVPNAEITVTNGQQSISAPLTLTSTGTLLTVVNPTDLLAISGNVTGSSAVTKLGAGTLVLTGSNNLTGAMTLAAGTLQIGGDGSFGSSLTVNSGSSLRINSANTTIAKPLAFDLASAAPAGISGGVGGVANFNLDIPEGSNVTISSPLNVGSGSTRKFGEGSLNLTNPGDNVIANVGGIAYVVQEGTVTIDGGATSTYSVNSGELAVGDNTANQTTLTLKSGTLNVATFTSVGRGNGTGALESTLNVTGGTLNTMNLFSGFANGVPGYNARPAINISGTSIVNAVGTAGNQGVRLGESAGSFSTLNVHDSATLASSADFQVGWGGTAVVNLTDSGTISTGQLGLGFGNNVAGNTGVGILNQSGGSFQQGSGFGGDWRIGGYASANDVQSYGSLLLTGGTFSSGGRNFQIGAFGIGVMDIRGGTAVSDAGFPVVGRFVGSFGLLNISSGSYSQNGSGNLFIIGEQGVGVTNLSNEGALIVNGSPGPVGTGGGTGALRIGHTATGIGILNLNGGTLTTSGIAETLDAASSYIYLNGSTIKPTSFNPTFFQGIDTAVVGPNGAIFDTEGLDITVAQALNAPAGQGVTTIPVTNGGGDYLGQPFVQISGGGGRGATAVANLTAGVVTSITVTNPGIDYTSAPTVTLLGGGTLTPATADLVAIAANITTGGLTKRGLGTMTLAGSNSYAGPTIIENGALALTGSITGSSAIEVRSGATLDVTGQAAGFVVTANQRLKGSGTVLGNTTVNGVLAPGDTLGTLTISGDLVLTSLSDFEVNKTGLSLSADLANVVGTLTLGGTLRVTASGDPLAIGDTFNLFDAASFAGSFSAFDLPALTLPLAWNTSRLSTDGTLVVVPEPSIASAGLLATGALLGLRRRRLRPA